jgi:ketosteroid isomerase-like protein
MTDATLADALTEHLAALQARDLERFAATVGDDVAVVDGSGAIREGRTAVLDAHADWFASPDDWRFDYIVRRLHDGGGAGLALIEVTYRQRPDAVPARFLLSLYFARDGGGAWKFLFDQNTKLGE